MKFAYSMPTRVIAGEGCLVEHAAALKEMGTKALIVTGRHSARANGSLDDALKALAAALGGKKAQMAPPADAERSSGYVVGGISPIDPAFIVNMAERGVLEAVDAVAVHGFPLDWNHWQIDEWPAKLAEIRAVTDLPIWVSEVGASSFGAEEVQAFGLQRTVQLLSGQIPEGDALYEVCMLLGTQMLLLSKLASSDD